MLGLKLNDVSKLWCWWIINMNIFEVVIPAVPIKAQHTNIRTVWYILYMIFLLTHWGREINGRHISDDIFRCIFFNANLRILLKIPLKLVPRVRISNIPALVQVMAWRRSGYKPLSEPIMVRSPTHFCVTRPQWVNEYFMCLLISRKPFWMG